MIDVSHHFKLTCGGAAAEAETEAAATAAALLLVRLSAKPRAGVPTEARIEAILRSVAILSVNILASFFLLMDGVIKVDKVRQASE